MASSGAGGGDAGGPVVPMCSLGDQKPVAVGDPVMLCIFLSTRPVQKMVFQIKVEQYAQLVLKGSQAKALKALKNDGMAIHTWAAVSHEEAAKPLDCRNGADMELRGNHVSCPQVYASSSHAAQLVNLVVNLEDGHISSFAWDNACAGCGP